MIPNPRDKRPPRYDYFAPVQLRILRALQVIVFGIALLILWEVAHAAL